MQPERLSDILPGVMCEIEQRRSRYFDRHRDHVWRVLKGFEKRRGHKKHRAEQSDADELWTARGWAGNMPR